jgi:hypothetical protein
MDTATSELKKEFQTDSHPILDDFQTWLQETGLTRWIITQLLGLTRRGKAI